MTDRKNYCPMRHSESGNCLPRGGFCLNAVNDEACQAMHSAYQMGYYHAISCIRDLQHTVTRYRGKRCTDGNWIYGSLMELKRNGDCTLILPPPLYPSSLNISTLVALRAYTVDPSTVGQYVWRQDSKGHQIYEGDIIEINTFDRERAIVRLDTEGKSPEFILVAEGGWAYDFGVFNARNLTIIGNIWDTPDLFVEE